MEEEYTEFLYGTQQIKTCNTPKHNTYYNAKNKALKKKTHNENATLLSMRSKGSSKAPLLSNLK